MALTSSAFSSPAQDDFRPDPKLEIRIAVRHALESVRSGGHQMDSLEKVMQEFPSMVEATLERERVWDAQAVGVLRMALGLEINPWENRATEAIRIFESARSVTDRMRFAAGLLQGETSCLPALAMAICRNPEGLGLLVAMHAVAPLLRLLRGSLGRLFLSFSSLSLLSPSTLDKASRWMNRISKDPRTS